MTPIISIIAHSRQPVIYQVERTILILLKNNFLEEIKVDIWRCSFAASPDIRPFSSGKITFSKLSYSSMNGNKRIADSFYGHTGIVPLFVLAFRGRSKYGEGSSVFFISSSFKKCPGLEGSSNTIEKCKWTPVGLPDRPNNYPGNLTAFRLRYRLHWSQREILEQ